MCVWEKDQQLRPCVTFTSLVVITHISAGLFTHGAAKSFWTRTPHTGRKQFEHAHFKNLNLLVCICENPAQYCSGQKWPAVSYIACIILFYLLFFRLQAQAGRLLLKTLIAHKQYLMSLTCGWALFSVAANCSACSSQW